MKSTPLKRTVSLQRKGYLQSDPERTRDWIDRSRQQQPPPVREEVPKSVRAHARDRSHDWCIVCLSREGFHRGTVTEAQYAAINILARAGRVRRARQLHHVLPVRLFPAYQKKSWNLVGICVACHDEHERAHRRISRIALPYETVNFCKKLGDPMAYYADVTYPK